MKINRPPFIVKSVGFIYLVFDIILSNISIGVFKLSNFPTTVLPGIILIVIGVWLEPIGRNTDSR